MKRRCTVGARSRKRYSSIHLKLSGLIQIQSLHLGSGYYKKSDTKEAMIKLKWKGGIYPSEFKTIKIINPKENAARRIHPREIIFGCKKKSCIHLFIPIGWILGHKEVHAKFILRVFRGEDPTVSKQCTFRRNDEWETRNANVYSSPTSHHWSVSLKSISSFLHISFFQDKPGISRIPFFKTN